MQAQHLLKRQEDEGKCMSICIYNNWKRKKKEKKLAWCRNEHLFVYNRLSSVGLYWYISVLVPIEVTSFCCHQTVICENNPFHTSQYSSITKEQTIIAHQDVSSGTNLLWRDNYKCKHTQAHRSIRHAYDICQTRLSPINVWMQHSTFDTTGIGFIWRPNLSIFDTTCHMTLLAINAQSVTISAGPDLISIKLHIVSWLQYIYYHNSIYIFFFSKIK